MPRGPTVRLKPEPIDRVLGPFHRFLATESAAGLVLLGSALVALVWANSPWSDSYRQLWKTELALSLGHGAFALQATLHDWVTDALMALFFFVVGLEIKREVLVGELSSLRQAALPIAAALGGMAVPAGLYLAANHGGETRGWGIPVATDIAFAIGVLALAGGRVPVAAKVFLAAFAIADDLGATVIIAVVYSEGVSLTALGIAFGFWVAMLLASKGGVRDTLAYVLLAAGMWLALSQSGVHPTIAGVLGALAVPARTRVGSRSVSAPLRELLDRFDAAQSRAGGVLVNEEQRHIMERVEHLSFLGQTPLQRLEHILHPWVSFGVMPLFALANAGVPLGAGAVEALSGPVSQGIVLGLVVGKPLGILSFCWLAVRLRLAELPAGVSWRHLVPLAILGGIGFTMSLFVADLAYAGSPAHEAARVGIVAGSLVAGVVGLTLLRRIRGD